MINDTKAVLTVSRNWLVVPGIVVYLQKRFHRGSTSFSASVLWWAPAPWPRIFHGTLSAVCRRVTYGSSNLTQRGPRGIQRDNILINYSQVIRTRKWNFESVHLSCDSNLIDIETEKDQSIDGSDWLSITFSLIR